MDITTRLAPFSQIQKDGQRRMTNRTVDQADQLERMIHLEMFDVNLCRLLTLAKEKPHISYWGEVYYLLYSVRKQGRATKKSMVLYNLPSGRMMYSYLKNCFVAVLPNMNINLQIHELTDALLMGRFIPSAFEQTTYIQSGN